MVSIRPVNLNTSSRQTGATGKNWDIIFWEVPGTMETSTQLYMAVPLRCGVLASTKKLSGFVGSQNTLLAMIFPYVSMNGFRSTTRWWTRLHLSWTATHLQQRDTKNQSRNAMAVVDLMPAVACKYPENYCQTTEGKWGGMLPDCARCSAIKPIVHAIHDNDSDAPESDICIF